ncbi:hypothetical protein GCM10015535_34230 [Streptomyces gelaticus]|uniref:Uncharacterized protein n=1 Tax=Streptomyces gelaticus TaxID=285446 RepID=A0ABQ2W2C2_9ACTN|nr:hypothetical protein GCM10015535_34230 [Streptomyces gelaticus]
MILAAPGTAERKAGTTGVEGRPTRREISPCPGTEDSFAARARLPVAGHGGEFAQQGSDGGIRHPIAA